MILETALADALYLNWAVPLAALPPPPAGLRYDGSERDGESLAFFSLVLFRQVGLHLHGMSWLGLSYPQVNARLYVRDAVQTASVLLVRQLVPGWVVPIGRLAGGQPFSAAVCEFPGGAPRVRSSKAAEDRFDSEREWRWRVAAGALFSVTARIGTPAGARPGGNGRESWEAEVEFFRDRTRAYWRQGGALRRVETEHPATTVLPVRAQVERADWLETFLPFAPSQGWTALHSAFLVPRVQLSFAFGSARELPVAAPVAAAG